MAMSVIISLFLPLFGTGGVGVSGRGNDNGNAGDVTGEATLAGEPAEVD